MKKASILIVLLATVWSFPLKAQSNCVTVVNNTSCDAYFQFMGSDSFCTVLGISGMMMIGAGASAGFSAPLVVPGLPAATVYMTGATLFTAPLSCAFSTFALGEPCSGLPNAVSYIPYTAACSPCSTSVVTTVWTSAAGACASLSFN